MILFLLGLTSVVSFLGYLLDTKSSEGRLLIIICIVSLIPLLLVSNYS